jgi:hypothetical protein
MANSYLDMVGRLYQHYFHPVTIWIEEYLARQNEFKVVTVKGSQCKKFMSPQEVFDSYTVLPQQAKDRAQAIQVANARRGGRYVERFSVSVS